jgi:regulator of protease activity HflC (stomatin/prohibitin superfamily)
MVQVVLGRRAEASDAGVPRVNVVAIAVLVGAVAVGAVGSLAFRSAIPIVVMLVVGLVLMQAPRIAQQWERGVVLRLGRFVALRGPEPVTVSSVEMRDIVIPGALQDAVSREAQAAREKQARIILGQAEMEIAHSFEEAAKSYQHNPTALHLRAMNMLYEGLKEKGALMLIPSSAVESMGMGGLMGAAALQQQRLTGTGGGADQKVE